jgi:hypothetical protein
MVSQGHFELNQHESPDGNAQGLPIYLGSEGERLPETDSLLDVVKIVNETIGREGYLTLGQLVDEVGQILASNETVDGILIEDEEDLSTVRISQQETTVSVRGKSVKKISSGLVFDALYKWFELGRSENT